MHFTFHRILVKRDNEFILGDNEEHKGTFLSMKFYFFSTENDLTRNETQSNESKLDL